jgi:hypothetical protein
MGLINLSKEFATFVSVISLAGKIEKIRIGFVAKIVSGNPLKLKIPLFCPNIR